MALVERTNEGWTILGHPAEPAYWHEHPGPPGSVLGVPPEASAESPPGLAKFCAEVAAALEEVGLWIASGVEVSGRRWADLGGLHGHYSLALRFWGAASAVMVDEFRPEDWVREVLEEAGVEIRVADANQVKLDDVECACILYAPEISVSAALANMPALRRVVTNDRSPTDHAAARLRARGWSVTVFDIDQCSLGLSEDGAHLRSESDRTEQRFFYDGSEVMPKDASYRFDLLPFLRLRFGPHLRPDIQSVELIESTVGRTLWLTFRCGDGWESRQPLGESDPPDNRPFWSVIASCMSWEVEDWFLSGGEAIFTEEGANAVWQEGAPF